VVIIDDLSQVLMRDKEHNQCEGDDCDEAKKLQVQVMEKNLIYF
jgi:hypothetical protein